MVSSLLGVGAARGAVGAVARSCVAQGPWDREHRKAVAGSWERSPVAMGIMSLG